MSTALEIACPEEIALRMGYIDREQLLRLAGPVRKSSYGQYLIQVANAAAVRVEPQI